MAGEIPLPTSIQNLLQEKEKAEKAKAQIEDQKRVAEQLLKQETDKLQQRTRDLLHKYGNMKSVIMSGGSGRSGVLGHYETVEGYMTTPAVKFKDKKKTYSLWVTEKIDRMGSYPEIDHVGAFIKIYDLSKKGGYPDTLLSFPGGEEKSEILGEPVTSLNINNAIGILETVEKAFQEARVVPGQFGRLENEFKKHPLFTGNKRK